MKSLRSLSLILTMAFVVAAFGAGPGNMSYVFRPIDDPNAGPLGTSVFGINSPGVMVGNVDTGTVIGGFVLRSGQFTHVTVDDSPWTDLYKVNNQGTAVGDFVDDQGNWHGFMYSRNGTITILPDPVPGAWNFPSGINSRGAVVGFFSDDFFATTHGYVYENGSFTFFDVPGSSFTFPTDINNSGAICGWYFDSGFIIDPKGTFTQIDFPGAVWTTAYGMNDHGDIVGSYSDGATVHGYLLRKGVFLTLDYPGADNTDAEDINNAGVIVGTYNGFSRGFVARPSQ